MKVSVIIPTFNEEKRIYSTLENLFSKHLPEEVIVVDGESTDQTVSVANEWTKVVRTFKGRARQMNEGVRAASGGILLFLDAGTRLPEDGILKLKYAIREGAKAGRFRISFDNAHWVLKLCAAYTQFQLFPFGSQGFFVRREVFEALGGFRPDAPFEDVDFYMRLLSITRPVIIKEAVVASAPNLSGSGWLWKKIVKRFLISLYYAVHKSLLLRKN